MRLGWERRAVGFPREASSSDCPCDMVRYHHGLVDCLKGFPQHAVPPLIDFRSGAEWGAIAALGARHNVSALLYSQLAPTALHRGIPECVLRTLCEAFLVNRAKNALLYQELARVLRALEQDGVPVIVLKGAHLAATVYEDMALRTMDDVDLMVQQTDLARTASRLRDLGYSAAYIPTDIPAWCERDRHLPRMSKPPCPDIEVHWTIAAPSHFRLIAPAGLWSRSQPATIAGVPTRVLSPEDLLLHLSLHAAQEGCGPFRLGLKPVCDLAAAIHRYQDDISWQQLQSRASEWRAEKCLYLAVRLAKELLTARIPDAALHALRPKDFDDKWAALAADQVVRRGAERLPPEGESALKLFRTFGSQSWRRKLTWLWRTAFPSRSAMAGYMAYYHATPLTPIRNYTCYFTRAIDWSAKGARLVWHWLRHRGQVATRARLALKETAFCKWLNDGD